MKTSISLWALVVATSVWVLGCGDSGSGGGGGSQDGGGGATDGGGSEGGAPGGGANEGGANEGGGVALAAPVLDEVEPMHGALHLFWTNVQPDCDTVEGERKEDDGAFENFFSVPGTVDNEMDEAATDPAVTYTYRVRCELGGAFSEYSNEISASPMP